MTLTLAQVRKFLVALVAAAAQAINLGLVPDRYKPYVGVAVALLGALGVYAVPNGDGPISPRSNEGDEYEPIDEPPAEDPPADPALSDATPAAEAPAPAGPGVTEVPPAPVKEG
jgi:hypothetical protein